MEKEKALFFFISLWIFALILYPVWLPFQLFRTRLLVFALLLVLIVIAAKALRKWLALLPQETPRTQKPLPKTLLIAYILFVLAQIPFLIEDLPFLSDETFHISRGIWLAEPVMQFFGGGVHHACQNPSSCRASSAPVSGG